MVNPLLTVLFDLFLVGSAITIIAAMVDEYFSSRTPSIGGGRTQSTSPGATASRLEQGRASRGALRKVA